MDRKFVVVGLAACFALLFAAPFAGISVFATTPPYSYSISLGTGSCAAPSIITSSFEVIGCTDNHPGPNSVQGVTNDPNVNALIWSYSGPTGTGSGTAACNYPSGCFSFAVPTTAQGVYTLILSFVASGGVVMTVHMDAVGGIFVTPVFPVGTIVAVLAPLAGLGLYVAARKGRLSFLNF